MNAQLYNPVYALDYKEVQHLPHLPVLAEIAKYMEHPRATAIRTLEDAQYDNVCEMCNNMYQVQLAKTDRARSAWFGGRMDYDSYCDEQYLLERYECDWDDLYMRLTMEHLQRYPHPLSGCIAGMRSAGCCYAL